MSRLSVVVCLLCLLSGAEAQEYRNDVPPDKRLKRTYSAPLAAVVTRNSGNLPKLLHELQHLGATYQIGDFDIFRDSLWEDGLVARRNTWSDQTEEITITLTPVAQVYGVAHLIELQLTRRPNQEGHTSYPIARVFPRTSSGAWLKRSSYPQGSFLRKVQELVYRRREIRQYPIVSELELTYSANRSWGSPEETWIFSARVTLVERDAIPAGTVTVNFYGVSGYTDGVYDTGKPFKPLGRPLRGDVSYLPLPAAARDRDGGNIWQSP